VLSFIFGLIAGLLIAPFHFDSSVGMASVAGAIFGLAVYLINFYGMTQFFPWFADARNWMSVFCPFRVWRGCGGYLFETGEEGIPNCRRRVVLRLTLCAACPCLRRIHLSASRMLAIVDAAATGAAALPVTRPTPESCAGTG
jgi:hypothetical protein